MSSRLAKCFSSLAARNAAGFVAYVTAGDPGPSETLDILRALDLAGTDVIELGVPFSDPLADGPTIQAAAGRALAAGMTVRGALDLVRQFRRESQTPVVAFAYLNPIYTYGFEKFLADAAEAGVDGLLLLDLPPEEAARNAELVATGGLDPIRLIAPTTSPARMASIAATARGFLYYVSREGVTGEQSTLADSLEAQIAELRRHTTLPIAVGFGISTPEQSAVVARHADAVVVGSAIVRRIAENAGTPDLSERIAAFVRPLADAAHRRN